MKAPCPVVVGYIRALRDEFRITPRLYEPLIEELDLIEARVGAALVPENARMGRDLRALRCLELAFEIYTQEPLGNPVDERAPPPTIERMKARLRDLALDHQAEAGEMGLLGVRKDDEQLRYSRLEAAGDLGGFCIAFLELVQECMRAPRPDGDLEKVVDVGLLFHRACVMGKVGSDEKVKFARDLLEPRKGTSR